MTFPRSPPRLLNAAAPGGLKPAPASRLREVCSHLRYSTTGRLPVFVTHTIGCPSSRNASADRACPPRSWWTARRRLMSHRRSCHRAATRRALRDALPPLRTLSSSVRALRADAGSSRSSSRPGSDRVRVRDRRTRASTGYRRALPRRPDRTDGTTAAGNRCATSPRSRTLDGRLEDPAGDNAVRSPPPALTTAPSPPSRLETRRALCASSCLHNLASRSSAARPYCRPRIKGAVCHDPEVDQSFLRNRIDLLSRSTRCCKHAGRSGFNHLSLPQ